MSEKQTGRYRRMMRRNSDRMFRDIIKHMKSEPLFLRISIAWSIIKGT